jgi:DNA polymerase III subunit alpha, Gram-positive type
MIVFNITDLSNSITVKLFDKKEFINNITNLLDEDSYVKVRGDVQFDKYTKEMIIMAKDIQREIFHDRVDNSEKKRVELHTHSQFSAMDGTSSIQSIIKTAANWGHSAIAVTDHGVLQAYPDAMIAGEKKQHKNNLWCRRLLNR